MSRLFYHVMQDNAGNLLFDVSGTMRLAGTGTAATIYGDEALTIPIANPMTNHPSFGSFKCFLGVGDYDFYMAKSGYTFETLTGVQGTGTMADQNANNVTITGGTGTFTGNCAFGDSIAINTTISPNAKLRLAYDKTTLYGMQVQQLVTDAGVGAPIAFYNVAGGAVGYIGTTGSATSYNTASDARLKHAIATLTGELDLMRALRPVSFLWNADGSPGVGFIASEVAAHVPGVIVGEQDAVDEQGGIIPQMIDYSKLVPFLVGACQTLAARLEGMEARLHVLEEALGV